MIAPLGHAIATCASTEQTAIATLASPARVWDSELVEHVATWAAEQGDTALESLCDEMLAGVTDEDVLLDSIRNDPALLDAIERGRNLEREARPDPRTGAQRFAFDDRRKDAALRVGKAVMAAGRIQVEK